MNTFETLLAFRFLLGAGVGLVMPLSFTLISDHFSGKEQTKMMGYNTAFSNFGGIVTMLLAGYLASFNWRLPFNVYWIGLIIFILVFFFLPKDKPVKTNANAKAAKIPMSIYGLALGSMFIMLVYYAIATNMAIYLEESQLGSAQTAGIVISFTTVGGIITSLILVRLETTLKKYLIPVSLLVMGLAFACLAFTHSMPFVLLGVSLVGFGQGVIFPLINVLALNQVERIQTGTVIAIVSSSIYIGQFLSPIVLDKIGQIAGHPTIRFQYGVIAVSMIVAFGVMFVQKLMNSEKATSEVA